MTTRLGKPSPCPRLMLSPAALAVLGLALAGCSPASTSTTTTTSGAAQPSSAAPAASSAAGAASTSAAPAPVNASGSCTKPETAFSTDDAPESANYTDLAGSLGPVTPPAGVQIGSIMKFLGNQYWQALADGQTTRAKKYSLTVDVQAASSESDQLGQLNAADTMLQKGYKVLLASPQSDTNLCPAVEKAEKANVLVLNVNDAVLPNAQHWVGPNQIQNGISAAKYMVGKLPGGSEVAVIEGQAGVYAARQRTKGFTDTANQGGLKVVASVPGDWDIQKARDAATTIMKKNPNLKAFYCNNDTMALGVVQAVNAAGLRGKVMIIGTDGIPDAYKAIKAGDLTATVDSYPSLTGQVAVDVALRILAGQKVPRAVYTPQALITKDNVDAAPPALG